ncbi:MAG: amidohydrolase family protein [Myxococcota bacterium]
MFDVVLEGGSVIDGTGAPARRADVGIIGDRIAAVGLDLGPARKTLDCKGLLVTPGWVDMHTHYDGQVTWDPHCTPSGWHGVTTVVFGNCGVGFAPCRAEDRDWLINVMEGVEDIPGAALNEGIQWTWETFPEFLDALDALPLALDIGAQIPHSAVRGYVMGRKASEDAAASDDEIAQMKAIVAEGLEAGALGFTTSRTSLHKTAEGVHVAGTFAEEREINGICEALGETGKGLFQLADEHLKVPQDMAWLRKIAEDTGRPVCVNLSQTDFMPKLWEGVLPVLDQARADGVPLYAQAAGRAIGILMCWRGTAHPFALHPTWKALSQRPWDEIVAALGTPEVRQALLSEAPDEGNVFEQYVTQFFHKMFPVDAGYEPSADQSIAAVAKTQGRTPLEVAYELMCADDCAGFLYFPLFNYSDNALDVLHQMHTHPQIRMGLSDGGAHCGAICDGGMPTFMITHWTRDRARGERLPLPWMVHRQTQQTARFYGLMDRGVVAEGYLADLNVIDYEALSIGMPKMVFDLPAGGRRLIQRAEGYRYTLKRGQITMVDGEATGALPGALVRGEQSGPAVEVAPVADVPHGVIAAK